MKKKEKQYIAKLHPKTMAVVQVMELLNSQRDNNGNLILVAKELR